MPGPGGFLISQEEEQALLQRLADRDVTAPSDLASLFLDHLIDWLKANNSRQIPDELCIEAAEDALIALIKRPKSCNPARGKRLASYLRMSAKGDLRNILQRKQRERRNQAVMKSVEVSDEAGNSPVVEDDPLAHLECQEMLAMATRQVVPVKQGLLESESRVLDLMLGGERKTAVFAEALGILHLPAKEQRMEVKRVKDKLKMRLKRERDNVKPS